MKQMRVLNCTKRQREAIFAIADEVGCPVNEETRNLKDISQYPCIVFNSEVIISLSWGHGHPDVSFSEFITELLKYEKPKVWVTKEAKQDGHTIQYIAGVRVETSRSFAIPQNARNIKCTYEIQEEQK